MKSTIEKSVRQPLHRPAAFATGFVPGEGRETAGVRRGGRGPVFPFDHDAMLVVDLDGRIRFCTSGACALIGRGAGELAWMPVAKVIPALPIRENTPGYNAAFVAFWFAPDEWHPQRAVDAHGRPLLLELAVEPVEFGEERAFAVALRRRIH